MHAAWVNVAYHAHQDEVEALRFQNVIVLWVFSNSLLKKSVWAFLILLPLAVFTCRQVEMRHRFEYLWTTSIPKTLSSAA